MEILKHGDPGTVQVHSHALPRKAYTPAVFLTVLGEIPRPGPDEYIELEQVPSR